MLNILLLRYFLHTLSRCDDIGCTELVRARTTWNRANHC